MKIRFLKTATARLVFAPGDEITVARLTPELERVLQNVQIDGEKVARIVDEDETADVDQAADEVAVMGKRRRVSRATVVSH